MSWRENGAGEFYWPLFAGRQEDHLRVWKSGDEGWMGALVLDGDYSELVRCGPLGSAREAMDSRDRRPSLAKRGRDSHRATRGDSTSPSRSTTGRSSVGPRTGTCSGPGRRRWLSTLIVVSGDRSRP